MPELIVKSERSTTRALVRFVNKSNRTVDIVWIDFSGFFVTYKTLKHNQYVDVDTYTNHPWIFLDSETRDLMKVKNKYLFYPAPIICKRTRKVGRAVVVIHLPLFSLRTNALLTVRNHLHKPDNVNSLELPVELKQDLLKIFEIRNRKTYTLNVSI